MKGERAKKNSQSEYMKRVFSKKGVDSMGEKMANLGPLRLMGFGMTTVLLNLHNAGYYELSSKILAVGLACGGVHLPLHAELIHFRDVLLYTESKQSHTIRFLEPRHALLLVNIQT